MGTANPRNQAWGQSRSVGVDASDPPEAAQPGNTRVRKIQVPPGVLSEGGPNPIWPARFRNGWLASVSGVWAPSYEVLDQSLGPQFVALKCLYDVGPGGPIPPEEGVPGRSPISSTRTSLNLYELFRSGRFFCFFTMERVRRPSTS